MASPKKPTRAELEKALQKAQADLMVLKRRTETGGNKMLPVLYLMRAGKDAEYVVGSSESLSTMPPAPGGAAVDAEGIYYKTLDAGADFSSLAAELERCLARFKSAETGGSYAVSFEEGKMWMDFVVGRATLEGIENAEKRQEFLRGINAIFSRAERVNSVLSDESDDETGSVSTGAGGSVGAGTSVKKAKDAKKVEEAKKIARFVKECCILDADAPLIRKDEVLGMYRIWAKGTTFYSNSQLIEYLRDERNLKVSHFGPTKDGVLAFKGIALKMDDWKYTPTPGESSVKSFLQQKCVFGPTEKTFMRTISEEYVKWRKEQGLNALDSADIARELREQLKACPILCGGTSITIGHESAAGWHGIGIIDESGAKPIRKVAFKGAKSVERRMPGEGGEVLESWPSVSQAAKTLGIAPYRVQTRISSAEPDEEGAILMFAKEKVSGDGASTSKS